METPEKRRKSKKAARTQHPQRYCPPSFLVKRMSLSDDRIELGVPARLNLLVLTVLTDIYEQRHAIALFSLTINRRPNVSACRRSARRARERDGA